MGRERELEEVDGLLARPSTRLLTLTGTGGVGKTRLAVEVARGAAHRIPDGVFFVGLAPLADPVLVVPTISRTLGAVEEGRSTLEVLQGHLRGKRLLLVLDNLEHLLEAAVEVAALIEASPGLLVLATSRAPLRVRGEHEYAVPPLALPPSTVRPSVAGVLGSPSGRLFLEHARAVSPRFAITQENVGAVATICWRLGGLPLALELAAAKARLLEPQALLARLDQALSTAWARDLPERQRTMRATLAWSHGLLSEPARKLFRRLSIFAGGFTLEAAEAVESSEKQKDVLFLLGALVEQSLIFVERASATATRYVMLEPVRQYALERLEESGEAGAVRRSHAEYFLALAERAQPELMGEQQVQWLERLDWESGNLGAATSWALDAGEAETAARLGWALWQFWWVRGYQREGLRWMEEVLERELSVSTRAKALVAAGTLAFANGNYEQCNRYAKEGLKLAPQTEDDLQEAWARTGLGVVAMTRVDPESAIPHLEGALRAFRRLGADFGVARITTCLGTVALMRGEADEATPLFEEGLAVARRIGERTSAYVTLLNLALIALSRGDHDDAAFLLQEGVILSEQVGDRANVAHCLRGLAAVAGARGMAERSARLFGAADGLLEVTGVPVYNYYHPDRGLHQRTQEDVLSRLGEATFEEAWDDGRAMTFEQAIAYARQDSNVSAP